MNARAILTAIAALVADVARQLAAVAPAAWRGDRVFRWAILAAGLSLCVLLGHFTALRVKPQALQDAIQPGQLSPTLPVPTASGSPLAASSGALASLPPHAGSPVPVIAPGQPMVTVAPPAAGTAPDRFGTVTRPRQPTARPAP